MRNAEADRLRDGWMTQQNLVDFTRPDLLSATIDQFLETAGEREIAVAVEKTLVAGSKPSVGERLCISLRIVLVARNHVGALNYYLTALSAGQQVARIVHDADLDS